MRWPILGLGAVVGACVAADLPDRDACGASGMQALVGQGRDVLAAMTVPAGTRVIRPGMAVTEDYGPARLNIDLNETGTVTRVWCG